jgi:hypothetical protein
MDGEEGGAVCAEAEASLLLWSFGGSFVVESAL